MVVGGVHTLWTMRKTIIDGLSGAFKATDGEAERLLRTEQDIPLRYVAMVVAGLVVLTFLFYWSTTGSLVLALAGALFLALVAFFQRGCWLHCRRGRFIEFTGVRHDHRHHAVYRPPRLGGGRPHPQPGHGGTHPRHPAHRCGRRLLKRIAGDVMQDLKTGNMVGATPWRQQTAEVVGVTVGALVIGPVLSLLHNAFRISATACLDNPLPSDPTCSRALFAPQAELIGAIAEGAFGGSINIQMVMLGVLFAIALIRLKMPVMSVAIGFTSR